MTFYDKVDVVINKNSKKIYFQNFIQLKYFNPKFIEICQEATEEDSKNFKDIINDKFSLFSMDIKHSKIGSKNSKKIKYALDNGIIDKFIGKDELINSYVQIYGISAKT
ncbi:MAG: hypothetical protein MR902_01455 [Campylobacter sp.]|nr:hypothetical protein [Campylobacter sp.]